MIRLGLIGGNIDQSSAPLLHRLAGSLCGLKISYELLVPARMNRDCHAVLDWCREQGFRGVNITYPFKEELFGRLIVEDSRVRAIGACNTAVFEPDGAFGINTDYTGFIAAFRESFPGMRPGAVAMAGAGGAGKAIGFALAELGAAQLRLFDSDRDRARSLAASLAAALPDTKVVAADSAAEATRGCDGVVNCTPIGMAGIPGTVFARSLLAGRHWAFDAVYTPVDTEFLLDAKAEGLQIMSGYELFFHQGVDAFRAFTGLDVDSGRLRGALAGERAASS